MPLDASFADAPSDSPGSQNTRVLVFTRTLAYRHESIADGVALISRLAVANGWRLMRTEEPATFNDASLAEFDVTVWLSTTGDVLDEEQQAAFQRYVESGGGFVGVHAASDTEYDWPWYASLVGAQFSDHPAIQTATLNVEDATHPASAHLATTFSWEDEWYNFRENPRAHVDVLLSVDESSYAGGTMGDHPIAWTHSVGQGRAFYTALGHSADAYTDPTFVGHLEGAIGWARRAP